MLYFIQRITYNFTIIYIYSLQSIGCYTFKRVNSSEKSKEGVFLEKFPAHIKFDSEYIEQTCTDHSRGAAEISGKALESVGLYNCGYFTGLLHDCGKFKPSFKEYILAASRGENVRRGSVVHTFAGVRYILENFHSKNTNNLSYDDIAAEILAYSVGAHHSLFDCVNEDGENGFLYRLKKIPEGDKEAVDNFISQCADELELKCLFEKASGEITSFLDKCCGFCSGRGELEFFSGLLVRLILSGVTEGDRRNTAEFMANSSFPKDADVRLWEVLLNKVEAKLSELPYDTPVNKARREISRFCREAAEKEGGVYRLNVPTGGGKTLSSLRYALAHAAKYGKSRVIFTSPLLSILEQNSKVIREYIDDESVILEHHSNIINDGKTPLELERYELLSENWSAPVIITTLVQLLNTMFDGKTASVRRFHALTNAVIVIDEVQTVPSKLITLFNLTISFLAKMCGTTVILCSATQPPFEKTEHSIAENVQALFELPCEISNVFKRTEIEFSGNLAMDEVASFAKEKLETANNLLIVCNKKADAAKIYEQVEEENINTFHLSASMCIAHRNSTLEKIYQSLKNKTKKTVCVSTQVIEAGVDISFECVIRLAAGMDSVIQSAGRCNRNGESEDLGKVYLVNVQDENLSKLNDIAAAKHATQELIFEYGEKPACFDFDLSSKKAVDYYYNHLYKAQHERGVLCHDYPLKSGNSIYNLLSINTKYLKVNELDEMQFFINQAFSQAGKYFEVFDSNTVDVIVPWGEGKEIINELMTARAEYDIRYLKELLDKAKPYTVSLYSFQEKKLEEQNALLPLAGGNVVGLSENFYSSLTGLQIISKEVYDGCNTLIW